MFKSILKIFGLGDGPSSCCGRKGAGAGSAEHGIGDLENFVAFVAKSLVDYPDDVRVSSEVGDERTVIKIDCRKEDIGKIVGKRGKTIMAIRSLASGAAGRLQQKITVEVVD